MINQYMQRCFDLAMNGLGYVAPNPMVGAVVVHNGTIIGEGYHQQYGGPHAEVNAIADVVDKRLLKDATLYVNLEPCSHYGKTPPCADLIIRSGIPRVVIATEDPNPLVAGAGIQRLRHAGIEVTVGVGDNEHRFLNRRFFCFQENRRPYIILKWAESADGFIDVVRTPEMEVEPYWITGLLARKLVHSWRAAEPGILIGSTTAIKDNPQLTTRDWPGRSPVRFLIDPRLEVTASHRVFSTPGTTVVIAYQRGKIEAPNVEYQICPAEENPAQFALNAMINRGVSSVIIEGGAFTLNYFLENSLWDEIRVFCGNQPFGTGVKGPTIHNVVKLQQTMVEDDGLLVGFNPALVNKLNYLQDNIC